MRGAAKVGDVARRAPTAGQQLPGQVQQWCADSGIEP